MKKALVIAAIILIIGAALFLMFGGEGKAPGYRTEKVIRGDIISSISATGTVSAVTTILVGTQVSGTIKNIYVDFNDPVKKGQLIAEIDPASFEAQVKQARANLLAAKANLEKSGASAVEAERTMMRSRELFDRSLIARSDMDAAETNFETARAQVNAARAQVSQAEASLSVAETNLRYTKIFSPVRGVVISRDVDVGQTVAASFQTPTLFTIAEDLTKMEIHTNVDEADIGGVRVGQTAEFTVDAYPDVTFKGKVWQIRNAPITVQNVVTYDVVIKIANPELKLKPGMTANVSIIFEKKEGVLKVSNAALRFAPSQPQRTDKGPALYLLDKGRLRPTAITTGISDGSHTEILSGDIREGQEVAVEPLRKENNSSPRRGPRMFGWH